MELFSWGANSYGQLGVGHQADSSLPMKVSLVEIVEESTFVRGGGGHSFLLSEDSLYACGWNSKGQLGLGHNEDVHSFVQVVSGKNTFRSIAAGWDFTIGQTMYGSLLSWGSNTFGQLSQPEVKVSACVPNVILKEVNCCSFAAGLRHSIFLEGSGAILCCGSGRKGQIGIKFDKLPVRCDQPLPVILPACSRAVQVVAGAYHSAALTESGQVIVWGDNKHGQCGRDPATTPSVPTPLLIPQDVFHHKAIRQLCSGWTHMLAVTADGQVFSWGRNEYSQLGRPCSTSGQTSDHHPSVVELPGPVVRVSCGSEHNLALLEGGRLLSWGWNEHGMCGCGNEQDVGRPQPIPTLATRRVFNIGSGNGHSFALVS